MAPFVKAGVGVFHDPTSADPAHIYLGGFIKPLRDPEGKGELILGGHLETEKAVRGSEFQIEYRSRLGLTGGGGFVTRKAGAEVVWGKLSYRGTFGPDWQYTATAQTQYIDTGTETKVYPGGYLAVYNPIYRFVLGYEGEQLRAQIGYVGPKTEKFFRPAFEALYVDNTMGELFDGARFFLINGTIRHWKAFFSNPPALGRAMGATGLEFGNPLGYLTPGTWNRRPNSWEIGTGAVFRLAHSSYARETFDGKLEVLFFPVELVRWQNPSLWDNVFVGSIVS